MLYIKYQKNTKKTQSAFLLEASYICTKSDQTSAVHILYSLSNQPTPHVSDYLQPKTSALAICIFGNEGTPRACFPEHFEN